MKRTLYVVVKAVRERTGPTETAFSGKTLAVGTIVPCENTTENEAEHSHWIQRADNPRLFVCQKDARNTYLQKLMPEEPSPWQQEIDAWARTQGYTGCKP